MLRQQRVSAGLSPYLPATIVKTWYLLTSSWFHALVCFYGIDTNRYLPSFLHPFALDWKNRTHSSQICNRDALKEDIWHRLFTIMNSGWSRCQIIFPTYSAGAARGAKKLVVSIVLSGPKKRKR